MNDQGVREHPQATQHVSNGIQQSVNTLQFFALLETSRRSTSFLFRPEEGGATRPLYAAGAALHQFPRSDPAACRISRNRKPDSRPKNCIQKTKQNKPKEKERNKEKVESLDPLLRWAQPLKPDELVGRRG